jgi:hypothetical protein
VNKRDEEYLKRLLRGHVIFGYYTLLCSFTYVLNFILVKQIISENIVLKANKIFILFGVFFLTIKYIRIILHSKPGYPIDLFWGDILPSALVMSCVIHKSLGKIKITSHELYVFWAEILIVIKMLNCILLLTYVMFCAQCAYQTSRFHRIPKKRFLNWSFLFDCFLWFISFATHDKYPVAPFDRLRLSQFYAFSIISNFLCGKYMINAVIKFRLYHFFSCKFGLLRPILCQQIHKEKLIILTLIFVFIIVTSSCLYVI